MCKFGKGLVWIIPETLLLLIWSELVAFGLLILMETFISYAVYILGRSQPKKCEMNLKHEQQK